MAHLDVFQNSAFEMAELTSAINKQPHKPGLLGSLGIFSEEAISLEVATVEEKEGRLALLKTSARGTVGDLYQVDTRKMKDFRVPHVPLYHTLKAGDLQNIRAFGSNSELMAVGEAVLEILQGMRDDHEVTQEYHRIGAIQGQVLDADASTVIYNYFTEFDSITETNVTFDMSVGNVDVQLLCHSINRSMSSALGMTGYSGILAVCGDRAFDALINHASVQAGFLRWSESEFFRTNFLGPDWQGLGINGFSFGGINWINYRGVISDVNFIPDAVARFIPLGVPGLFKEIVAPADTMQAANTRGQRFYAMQERLPFDKGIKFHTQSNILAIPNRPAACIKGTFTNIPSIVPAVSSTGEFVVGEGIVSTQIHHVAKPGDKYIQSEAEDEGTAKARADAVVAASKKVEASKKKS